MKSLISVSVTTIFALLLFLNSSDSHADTIILKNGKSVLVDRAWEEGDYIRGLRIKNTIGFHKNSVEKVIYENDSDSFTFDVWTGGITLNKAFEIAESYDLPIKAAGIISSATKFNSSVRKYINTTDNFSYKTKLMGKSSEVTLCFTPINRLLYKVVVHLYGTDVNREGKYRNEVEATLIKEYGAPDKSKGIFKDRCNWNVNNQYSVNMIIGMSGIDIVYSDNALDNKNSFESKATSGDVKFNYKAKNSGTINFSGSTQQRQKGVKFPINSIFKIFWYLIPIIILFAILKTPLFKGLFGEMIVNIYLKIFLNKDEYHLIRNVILDAEDGSTQIDHIIVSKYGVFVIETKNMKGWIFGSPDQKMWTQKIYRFTETFQNPLHQNYKHLKTLESVLGIDFNKFHSLVVFVGNSTFKTAMPENVTTAGGCIRFIKSKKDILLGKEEIKTIIDKIQSKRWAPSFKAEMAHVKNVKKIINQKRNIKNKGRP